MNRVVDLLDDSVTAKYLLQLQHMELKNSGSNLLAASKPSRKADEEDIWSTSGKELSTIFINIDY
jgi:hypothetical protein